MGCRKSRLLPYRDLNLHESVDHKRGFSLCLGALVVNLETYDPRKSSQLSAVSLSAIAGHGLTQIRLFTLQVNATSPVVAT